MNNHLLLSSFPGTLMRNNSAMTRMMTTYTRRPPGKNYVKTFFSIQLEELATLEDSLEINSIKVTTINTVFCIPWGAGYFHRRIFIQYNLVNTVPFEAFLILKTPVNRNSAQGEQISTVPWCSY